MVLIKISIHKIRVIFNCACACAAVVLCLHINTLCTQAQDIKQAMQQVKKDSQSAPAAFVSEAFLPAPPNEKN